MSLSDSTVGPIIPIADLDRAKAFYEDALGLEGEETPGGYVLHAAGETRIFLLEVPASAGMADYPVASFRVEDIEANVAALKENGVPFLTDADLPFDLDDHDVSRQGGVAVAWMRDPFGSVVTLFELS